MCENGRPDVCVCVCVCVLILKFLSRSCLKLLRGHAVRGLATSKTLMAGLSFGRWMAYDHLLRIACRLKVKRHASV